jgi:serine/threonine-protein kinase
MDEAVDRGPDERLIGCVVAEKYRIDRLLGRGGMGAVFEATHLSIGKRVALKFLSGPAARDAHAAERFQREALAASLVESSHIVQIFDSGRSADGLPFLVMELLRGEDLRTRLKREHRLPVDVATAIALQVLRGLIRAHRAGIVHRDLKPDNVFLCERDDGSLLVKLVDFGISKLGASTTLDTLTHRGTVLGTAYYISPEQAQADPDVDGRTDLFSVGTMLYECLAGRPPHTGPTYEAVLIAICTKDAEPIQSLRPEVPAGVAAVIERALSRDRARRFANAEEMLNALTAALPEGFTSLTDPKRSETVRSSSSLDTDRVLLERTSQAVVRDRVSLLRGKSRTLLFAALSLIAGFVLTGVWVSKTTRPAPSSTLRAEPIALAAAAPTSADPISPGPEAASVSAPIAPAPAAAPAVPSVAAGASSASRKARSVVGHQRHRVDGVAQGLELSTREP